MMTSSARDDAPISRREYERMVRQNQVLGDQVRALLVLQNIANTVSAELDLPVLLRQIAIAALRLVSGSASALFLLDPRSQILAVEAVETLAPEEAQPTGKLAIAGVTTNKLFPTTIERAPHTPITLGLGLGLAGQVAATAEPLLVNNPQADPRFGPEVVAMDAGILGIRPVTLLCVPLVFKGEVIGVLEVGQTQEQASEGFDARDLDLLYTLAAQAATAVANTRLYQNLRGERDRIISAQEDVRKQLARDLHDGPAQALATMAVQLEFAQRLAEHEPAKLMAELKSTHELALRTTRDIRNLLFDLRPLVLETEGLEVALRRFLERFQTGGGPEMHFDAQYTTRLPHNAEAVTFAIAQEAINNVLKHAQAANCWIELRERPQVLVLIVRDDGQGFDVQRIQEEYQRRGSWGMLNMYERAALVDATLGVRSQPGQGTVVMLSVPREPR
jgi:signal transduction histidine kinase